MLERIRIVLCETSHPGNIGAVARAMKTMGLGRLVLVNPKDYPSADATARASGADDVLATAEVVSNLDAALAGVSYAVGTSARLRRIPMPQLDPRESARQLVAEAATQEVAVLFGRERSGLSNAEIDRCHALVNIPANPDYQSLNLGAAAQVICYELRMAMLAATATSGTEEAVAHQPATGEHLESFFGHLEAALLEIGFLDPKQSQSMLRRLRRLFQRARPDDTEIHILRGILSRAQAAARKDPEAG
ncbi:MAG: RNA methyltransferase [Xanthomonadales bacterium]|nr:RNA methyltransferase [Xanthomonadales bacterium]